MYAFALTQVEDLVLRPSPRVERVCSCRQRCLAQQQRQEEKEEQRRSGYSHRLSHNQRPAHVPRYLYQPAIARMCTQTVHTHTHTTARTMSGVATKAERWIVLL